MIKFASFEAKVHFEKAIEVNKGFMPKRRMDFTDVITILGWKRFIKELKTAIKYVVLEFYGNIPDIVDNVVKV